MLSLFWKERMISDKVKIISSELLSTLSSQIIIFCISVVSVKYLHATSTEVGLINTISSSGIFLFLFLLSPLTDVKRTDILLIILSVSRALISFLLIFLYLSNSITITILAISSFFIMGMNSLYDSTISAYIPKIIDSSQLTSINGWIAALRSLSDIIAGTIAGVLMAFYGPHFAFLFVGIFYVISIFGPLSFKKNFLNKNMLENNQTDDKKKWFFDIFHGFKILFNNKVQKSLNIAVAQFNLFTTVIQTMYILYLMRYANMNEVQIGISTSIAGIIALFGVFLTDKLYKKFNFKKIIGFSLLIPGISGLLIVMLPFIPVFFQSIVLGISFGIWSLCVIVNITSFETLKQQTIPEKSLGRYSSASRCLTWGIDPIGALIATFLAFFIPLNLVLIIACIGVIFSSFWISFNPIFNEINLKISDK